MNANEVAKRLRVIAEDQLFSEGFYTQAHEVAKAADLIDHMAEHIETLVSSLLMKRKET